MRKPIRGHASAPKVAATKLTHCLGMAQSSGLRVPTTHCVTRHHCSDEFVHLLVVNTSTPKWMIRPIDGHALRSRTSPFVGIDSSAHLQTGRIYFKDYG